MDEYEIIYYQILQIITLIYFLIIYPFTNTFFSTKGKLNTTDKFMKEFWK